MKVPPPGSQQTLQRWEDFIETVALISEVYPAAEPDHLLFRGQANYRWPLATTLERWAHREVKVLDYYQTIGAIKPEIESFTDRKWDTPTWPEIHSLLSDYRRASEALLFSQIPGYEYLTHLPHYGYPSPLLDWTKSPNIAAFFAYSDSVQDQDVAIYIFNERPNGNKGSSSNSATITTYGPTVRTHKRRFLQQSEYSVCTYYKDNSWYFEEHEEVFRRADPDQDFLWKFALPSSERAKVMSLLDTYNRNQFSLFGSEESLMECWRTAQRERLRSFPTSSQLFPITFITASVIASTPVRIVGSGTGA